jgi:heptosyltransferase I
VAETGRSICIVMLTAVGDAVHVLPVIHALKRQDPATRVTWLLQPGPAALVQGHPAVDEIFLFERDRGARAFVDVRRALAGRRFDVALALQPYFKAGVLTALVPAPIRLGYDRQRARDLTWLFTNRRLAAHAPQHVQDEFLEFAAALGAAPEPLEWRLGPWPHERERQRALLASYDRPVAVLVVGTTKPEKNWIPERWAELADALYADFGLLPVLAGGRSALEQATERAILSLARHRPPSTLGRTTLRDVVALLDGAALVVSLDTGPLHMAVALDRPVVSLIGYKNPVRFGPYRRFHDLIVNAYGETHRNGRLATDSRPDRMRTVMVRDALERVQIWRERYARGAAGTSAPNR